VAPSRTSKKAATPATKDAREMIRASRSPNDPAMTNMAAGNDDKTIKTRIDSPKILLLTGLLPHG